MERIQRVGVVGLGTMGAGIAQLAIEAGLDTIGLEADRGQAEAGRDRIAHFLTRKVEKGQLDPEARDAALARLCLVSDVAELGGCELVIEAVFEELGAKRAVFASLERACGSGTVLATNTSALSVGAIAAGLDHPERVVGMHFFNPAPLMPLVEIVRAERTDDDVFETAFELGARLGKTPIRCNDTPGFVVNRVLIPLLNDCVRVLDETGVTPEDLDSGMKHGAGWPMGPCALLDLVGWPRPRASCAWSRPASSAGSRARASTRTDRVRPRLYRARMAMCQICRRTLLAGERYRTWRWARRDQTVCVVCEPAARDCGAIRIVDTYEHVRVGGLTRHVRRVA